MSSPIWRPRPEFAAADLDADLIKSRVSLTFALLFVVMEKCLPRRCLAKAGYFLSIIPVFRRHFKVCDNFSLYWMTENIRFIFVKNL
jgi:hypothetical protein